MNLDRSRPGGVFVDPFTGEPLPVPSLSPDTPPVPAPDVVVDRDVVVGRDGAAYEVRCKKCRAQPGQPCTYVGKPIGRYQREADLRRGLPTLRPHQERRDARRRKEIDAARRAWVARARVRVDPVAAERRALVDFARREHDQLRAWLACYARVLIDPAPALFPDQVPMTTVV